MIVVTDTIAEHAAPDLAKGEPLVEMEGVDGALLGVVPAVRRGDGGSEVAACFEPS